MDNKMSHTTTSYTYSNQVVPEATVYSIPEQPPPYVVTAPNVQYTRQPDRVSIPFHLASLQVFYPKN